MLLCPNILKIVNLFIFILKYFRCSLAKKFRIAFYFTTTFKPLKRPAIST